MPSKSDKSISHKAARSLSKQDFESLSEFRFQMRRFERFSENAAQAEGITPLQYFVLLHIKGFPGRHWASVGELAERLQIQPHSMVALVSRCETAGLVERRQSDTDRRLVEVHLLDQGNTVLMHLAALHRAELKLLGGAFQKALINYQESMCTDTH
jgi:DNA-binding MarR family transcriptional regulator